MIVIDFRIAYPTQHHIRHKTDRRYHEAYLITQVFADISIGYESEIGRRELMTQDSRLMENDDCGWVQLPRIDSRTGCNAKSL